MRQRTVLRGEDLVSRALIVDPKDGKVFRLGPPKKKNVNKNVVNHCQLYARNGRLAEDAWRNLSNLRDFGFRLYHAAQPATPAPAVPVVATSGAAQVTGEAGV